MSSGPYRLAYGGDIDRTRRIGFHFDGRSYFGHPGDTLASALLANGVRHVARSFKFHRPRGVYTCGFEEPNALMQVGEGAKAIPSARAPVVELEEGLQATSQQGWPGLRFDLGRILDFTSPLWSAGFYNKTFIWPRWHTYEAFIRRLAGLGRAPQAPDPDRYELVNHHCDLLVIGGGRSGMCAALDSARAGARVVLAEQDRELGGRILFEGAGIGDLPPRKWLVETVQELGQLPGVRLLTRTTPVGVYDHNVVALAERMSQAASGLLRERLHIVRASRIVLATGVIEQPLVFANNDRPGVVLASAARQYLRRYGVAVGRQVLIATNNDSAYALAGDFIDAGIRIGVLIDSRPERNIPEELRRLLRNKGIEWHPRSVVVNTKGFDSLQSVTVGKLSADEASVGEHKRFACDALAMSGGFAPALSLYAQAGGSLAFDESSGALQAARVHPGVSVIGSAARAVASGTRFTPIGNKARQWVDLAHDVTVADLEQSVRENYREVEHVKRYTTVGMAADQGKTSQASALAVISRLRGVQAAELGHTTLRPPVVPVTVGTLVGRERGDRFSPKRLLPMHGWHVRHGAVFQDFGGWQRPVAYPAGAAGGESRAGATAREAHAVRTAAGLFDASSLGKIEVQGPDALEFLDRFYLNNLKTLQPGRVRYGLMLRETGTLLDDGTVVGLAPDHLLVTTTSGNAGRIYHWLEEWRQCEWPELNVAITSVTEQWATISLAGPKARTILSGLDTDIDLSNVSFPHLTMREGRLLGAPARIYRVSFSGELTYEINVPSDFGPRIWETLVAVGAPHGLEPVGIDALMRLRLEKGFLHIGSDTDTTTVPDDVGWGRVASAKTRDYIGRRSLSLPEHVRPDRLQLVGLLSLASHSSRTGRKRRASTATVATPLSAVRGFTIPPDHAFAVGTHLRLPDSTAPSDGWITSAGVETLSGVPIALAMLRGGRHRVGTEVTLYDAGSVVGNARVVTPPFYDPSGERMYA